MRLAGQKVFLLLIPCILACRDTSGPSTVSARFVLHDVNGRSLPTYFSATPGLTLTILSSTVVLDRTGQAVVTEHQTLWNGSDFTSTINYTYKISGTQITFALPPAPIDPARNPPKGTITSAGLTLEMAQSGSFSVLYDYQLDASS